MQNFGLKFLAVNMLTNPYFCAKFETILLVEVYHHQHGSAWFLHGRSLKTCFLNHIIHIYHNNER